MGRAAATTGAIAVIGLVMMGGCATSSRPMSGAEGVRGSLPPGLSGAGSESFPRDAATGASPAMSMVRPPSFYDRTVEALTDNAVVRAIGSMAPANTASERGTTSDILSLSRKPKPPGPDLHTSMARLSERTGNLEGAIKHYETALSIDATSLDALMGYAHLHDRQGNFEEAIAFYRRAVQHHPEHAAAHNDLGLCLARSGQLDNALAELERAVAMQPGRKLYHNNLATVLAETDRRDEALAHWSRANGLAVAHYNLGRVLQRKGLIDEASHQYRMALQVDGTLSQAGTALALMDRADTHTASRPAVTSDTVVAPRPGKPGAGAGVPAPVDGRPVAPRSTGVASATSTTAGTPNPARTSGREWSGDPVPPTPDQALGPQSVSVHLPPVVTGGDQPGEPPTPDQVYAYPKSSTPYVYPGYPPRRPLAPYQR